MPFPVELLRDLAALSQVLDEPDHGLAQIVAGIAHDTVQAVPSYLGLVIRIDVNGQDVVLNAFDDATQSSDSRTSLMVSFAGKGIAESAAPAISLVLYAETPGAFVDMTADLAWLDSTADLVLDRHLPAPNGSTVSDALLDLRTVNQALGVLLARGNTPEQAELELSLVAEMLHVERADAAASILAGLDERPQSAG